MTPGDEIQFLTDYCLNDYERPSVTTDIALFTIRSQTVGDYRKLPQKKLSVLLIKRGEHPFKEMWALPGGFVRPHETVEAAAIRELSEESGITNVNLRQLHVFSEKDRDPRGWIISCGFMALAADAFVLKADTDAVDSDWFDISLKEREKTEEEGDGIRQITWHYELRLISEKAQITAVLKKQKTISATTRKTTCTLISSEGLAFDHGKIMLTALTDLRENLDVSLLAYTLMPETFTLTELQMVYEVILDKKLTAANFRRKTADYVIETEQHQTAAGHRPAKLFRRNLEAFETVD
jgi:ADP-ribose pyrophosphatase YjhB (NUDIX family)